MEGRGRSRFCIGTTEHQQNYRRPVSKSDQVATAGRQPQGSSAVIVFFRLALAERIESEFDW
jgi:hypothetical protein